MTVVPKVPLGPPANIGAKEEAKKCQKHPEVYQGICTVCHHILSSKEMDEYRQFAFLHHQKVMVHHDEGIKQVEQKMKDLINRKQLVLVLDLDNTLIHSKEVKHEELVIKRHSKSRNTYVELLDDLRSVYEARLQGSSQGFHIKLRPFLAEFLM